MEVPILPRAQLALLMVSIVLATVCTLLCALEVRWRIRRFPQVLSGLFGFLLVTQSSLVGFQLGGPPQVPSAAFHALTVVALGLLACSLVFNRHLFSGFIGVLVCGVDAVLLVIALVLFGEAMRPVNPACPTGLPPGSFCTVATAAAPLPGLVYLHVAAIVLSYIVLTMAFISALAYLLRERGLKGRSRGRLVDSLPPLATLEKFTNRFVLAGFAMLTVGIVLSQVWVALAQRPSAFFDPRESWVLVSWALYGVYAGIRLALRWQGRRLAFLVIAGYATSLAPAAVLMAASPRPA